MVMQFIPPPLLASEDIVACEYLANPTSASAATTFNFSAVNFGNPSSGRVIIVMAVGRETVNRSFVSGSIGGVAASLLAIQTSSGSHALAFAAIVPSGNSGDISFTMSGSMLRAALAVYRATGVKSLSPVGSAGSTANNGSLAIPTSKGGVALGISYGLTSASGWSGLTQRVQNNWTSNGSMSSAMDLTPDASGSRPISATMAGTPVVALSIAMR